MELGISREWLAEKCHYSKSSIVNILAPGGSNRSLKALTRISEVLTAEEARQAAEKAAAAAPPPVIPERQQLVLRPTDAEYEAWSAAQTATGHPTVRDWAVDSLNETAARLAALTDLRAKPPQQGKKQA